MFAGRVLSIDQHVTHLAVLELFGGALGATVTLGEKGWASNCDYPFQVGESYLVYAYQDPYSGALKAEICSRTAPLDSSSGDVAHLRRALAAKPGATGPVEGVIHAFQRNPAGGRAARLDPVPGVTVTIEGTAGSYKAISNSNGQFRIENVLMGEYEAHADVPEAYHRPAAVRFRVWEPERCGELRIIGLWPRQQ